MSNHREQVLTKYTIIQTGEGFMIEYETSDEDDSEFIHTPSGDNTFDTYEGASIALAYHVLRQTLRAGVV